MSEKPNSMEQVFPCWMELSETQQADVQEAAATRHFTKGEVLVPLQEGCEGLLLVKEGQLRAFILSETGKEVTLYRLFAWDVCLFSAACIMQNIQFDIHIGAEKDTEAFLVPPGLYARLIEENIAVSNFTNNLMSSRFSEVMWTLEQVLFKSFDARLAAALLAQANIEGGETLHCTHEEIARNMGTAREVVTRMLKYFAGEGLVTLARGSITIENPKGLARLAQT